MARRLVRRDGKSAALTIQRSFRGMKGRQKATDRLWDKMEEEDRMRREKQAKEVQQGWRMMEAAKEKRQEDDEMLLSRQRVFAKSASNLNLVFVERIQRWARKVMAVHKLCKLTENKIDAHTKHLQSDIDAWRLSRKIHIEFLDSVRKLRELRETCQELDVLGEGKLQLDQLHFAFQHTFSDDFMDIYDLSKVMRTFRLGDEDFYNYPMFCFAMEATLDKNINVSEAHQKIAVYFENSPISAHDMFSMFDTDGDGTIDTEEFRETIEGLGLGLSANAINALGKRYDMNHNGNIDYAEMVENFGNRRQYRTSFERLADIVVYWQELVKHKNVGRKRFLTRAKSNNALLSMGHDEYNSPKKLLDENSELFSAEEASMVLSEQSHSVGDDNWMNTQAIHFEQYSPKLSDAKVSILQFDEGSVGSLSGNDETKVVETFVVTGTAKGLEDGARMELEGKLRDMDSKCHRLETQVRELKHEKKSITDDYDSVVSENNKLKLKLSRLEDELQYSHDQSMKEDAVMRSKTTELLTERNSSVMQLKVLQQENAGLKTQLMRAQSNSSEDLVLLRAENKTLTEERNNAHRNVTRQIGMLDEIMKNMERLTKLKIEAEEKYSAAMQNIHGLNKRLEMAKTSVAKAEHPQPASLSTYGMEMQKKLKRLASKHADLCRLSWGIVHRTTVDNGSLHHFEQCIKDGLGDVEFASLERGRRTEKGKPRSPYRYQPYDASNSGDDVSETVRFEIDSLRKNLMKTIVSNRIFRAEELEFLFRSTLEFTKLDKALVQTMIGKLSQELDLGS
jgi:Ca2+-binding EF-hand superfamily protein